MKTKNLIWAMLCFAAVACEKSPQGSPSDDSIHQETYNKVQQLIADGGNYDLTNVADLLNVGNDYGWQLNAVVVYDSDFKSITDVYDDFDENQEYDSDMPIYVFGVESKLWSYDMDQANGAISSQVGSWNFDPRTLKLSLSIPKYADNDAIGLECTLCAVCSDAIVIEWLSEEEKALRAVFDVVALRDMELSSINIITDNLMNECRTFDAEAMVNGLQGEWMVDSSLIYNEDWTKVVEPLSMMGNDYVDGLGYVTYVFNNENVEVHSYGSTEPDPEPVITQYTWSYDAATGNMTFTGDSSKLEYVVSGFSDSYLILDSETDDGNNLRTILKRQQAQ